MRLCQHEAHCILAIAVLTSAGALGACWPRRGPLRTDAGGDASTPPGGDACDEADGPSPLAIPLGTYAVCSSRVVQSASTAEGAGGTIMLTANAGALTVAIGKGSLSFARGSLAFTATGSTAAVVAPGQTYAISNLPCATSTISSGALAVNGDTLTLFLIGEGCGDPISGTLTCKVPTTPIGGLTPSSSCGPSEGPCGCEGGPPAFMVGTFGQCTESVAAFGHGTISLTESQGVLTAAVAGLTGIAADAKLQFMPVTRTTATIMPDQTWIVSVPGAFAPYVSDRVMITSGSIVLDGSTLFAFVHGTDATGADVPKTFHCVAVN